MPTPIIHGLHFKQLELDGRVSISTDLTDEQASGIYAYEFTDGMWYVGKSKNVKARHVQHMHEYRHECPARIPKRMLWAEVHGDERQLDYAETQTIAWFEQKGYPLLNVMKTGRPRGEMSIVVDTGAGWGVPIPWERENLPKSIHPFKYQPDREKRNRFERLKKTDCYAELAALLRYYIRETIPAPEDTAGTLWTATALPTTSGGSRLCTISCQNAETLVIFKGEPDDAGPSGFVNVKQPEGGALPKWRKRYRQDYGTLPNAIGLYFDTLEEADRLLHRQDALEACYRANAELLRRGASMYRRFNNPYLVEDLLRESVSE